jgi:hypothetical protein
MSPNLDLLHGTSSISVVSFVLLAESGAPSQQQYDQVVVVSLMHTKGQFDTWWLEKLVSGDKERLKSQQQKSGYLQRREVLPAREETRCHHETRVLESYPLQIFSKHASFFSQLSVQYFP